MAKDTKKKICKSEHKDYGKKGKLPSVDEDQTIESQTVAAKHRHKREKKQNKKEEEMMYQDNGQDEEMTELKKKKHKKKNEDKLAHSDVGASEGVPEDITILKIKKKKKHKKSKKQTSHVEAAKSGECSGCESTLNAVVASTEQHKKKRKKHACISKKGECSEGVELGECSSSKKKHKKHLAEDSLTDTEYTNVKKDKECNKEGGELSDGDCRVNKKRVLDKSVTEHTRIKKQKLSNGHGSLDYSSSTTKVTGSEKKRKKKVKHGPAKGELEVVPLDSNVKKSKKEKKQKKCDNGLILSGTSPLDGDEIITVEKKRKNKKLGGETDKSSLVTSSHDESMGRGVGGVSANKQTNGTTPDGANPRFLGQWGTAELASGERQNKFFRLLGGFKASTGQKVATGGSFNSALTAGRETLLNKTLETQFDNAMSYVVNKQRGGGLGYSAPPGENKKFHIDTTFSKSVKFDD